MLSVIMPVYNEGRTLEEIIGKVLKVPVDLELIVVDNASTDNTPEILNRFKDRDNITVVAKTRNIGKGDAVRAGLEYARGDYTVIQDGDLEYNPDDLAVMLETAERERAITVFGSRILGRDTGISYYRYLWGGKLLTFIANLLYGVGITDESTCYKMIRTDVLKGLNLQCRRFEFCPEVVAKLGRNKIKILEIPISYHPRSFEEGKKISGIDGLEAIWTLIKYRLKSKKSFSVKEKPGKPGDGGQPDKQP
jgi:dolichol-phosphate mannosyltransferase